MEIIAVYGTVMVVMAMIFGLFMTWGVGANDLANAMGTSVGAGADTPGHEKAEYHRHDNHGRTIHCNDFHFISFPLTSDEQH